LSGGPGSHHHLHHLHHHSNSNDMKLDLNGNDFKKGNIYIFFFIQILLAFLLFCNFNKKNFLIIPI
jgi:hypothetical protein